MFSFFFFVFEEVMTGLFCITLPTDAYLAYFCIHLGCPMAIIKQVFENFAEMCLGECVSVFNFVTLSKYIYEMNLKCGL